METKVKIENVSVNKTTHNHGLSKKTFYKVHIYSFDDLRVSYDFDNRQALFNFLLDFFDSFDRNIKNTSLKTRVAIDRNTFQGVRRYGLSNSYFSNLQYFPNCCARCQAVKSDNTATLDYRFFLEKCKSSVNTQK